MSKKARNIRLICVILIGGTLGWLGFSIWLIPPIKEYEAIVVFVALFILWILHFAVQIVE